MTDRNLNALPAGCVVDGYRIERELGSGGFGITYLAIEIESGRRVAIKEFLPKGIAQRSESDLTVRPADSGARAHFEWGLGRFRDEAKALIQFRHPNIVWTLRLFSALGTAYIVMDYVEGESLADVLRRKGTLSAGETAALLGPLLDGLAAVHAGGYLHRDIKPANIYIREANGQPVLLDFGAARQALGRETQTLSAIVTPCYSPPEQYGRGGKPGAHSDIYAVGATLYRCIAGEPPPDAPDRVSAMVAGRPDPLVPASEIGRGRYDPGLLEAIDGALSIRENERPQSVTDLRRTLLREGGDRVNLARADTAKGEETLLAGTKVAQAATAGASPGSQAAFADGRGRRSARSRLVLAAVAVMAIAGAASAGYFVAIAPPGKLPAASVKPGDTPADRDPQRAERERQERADAERRRTEEEARRKADEAKKQAEEQRKREEAERAALEEERKRREEEAAAAAGRNVKIGGLFGITGPIASLVPPIVDSAKLAVKHVNDQGGILGGKLELLIGDGQCNPQAATAAAKKLVDIDQVVGIVGELCSGATIAAAEGAAIPAGVVMISPSSTAPAISTLKDRDFVFRTCPSDAFQGEVQARYLVKRGIRRVALTYMNNSYGRGAAAVFREAYRRVGGTITADLEHNERGSSFRSELATLARGNPEYLLVIAYGNASGAIVIKQALEGGFFKKFIGTEGIRDPKLYTQIGIANLEGTIISATGEPAGRTLDTFNAELAKANRDHVGKPYTAQAYDATFMLALAIEAAGSPDRVKVRDALRQIGSAGGIAIGPGEWKAAKEAIAKKQKIFYTGAAGNHVFNKDGDVSGVIDFYEIRNGKEVKVETNRP